MHRELSARTRESHIDALDPVAPDGWPFEKFGEPPRIKNTFDLNRHRGERIM